MLGKTKPWGTQKDLQGHADMTSDGAYRYYHLGLLSFEEGGRGRCLQGRD